MNSCMRAIVTCVSQSVSQLKDGAEQQVKARNSQEALEERGSWFTIDWLSSIAQALDVEGWARMHRLEIALGSPPLREFVGKQCERRAQFDWLCDWIVFSLFIDIPPMWPQNSELQILEHAEPAGQPSDQWTALLPITHHIADCAVQECYIYG